MTNLTRRTEPFIVEKILDELWIEVKCQSNSVIARSPRNCFKASLKNNLPGGRALFELGVLPDYRTLTNSEYRKVLLGSGTVVDKLHRREGNSPDHQLRPLNAD